MPSRMDEAPAPTLSQSINIATRSVHTRLNKLIIFRLPLALPPQADDGSNYVSGLLHVAPIYIAFESLWKKMVESSPSPSPEPDVRSAEAHTCPACIDKQVDSDISDVHTLPGVLGTSQTTVFCSRIRTILTDLRFPEMIRSQALQDDLMALTGWSSLTLSEHLNDASETPVLSSFLNHIRHAVGNRPHVLLAYGWVLYMALFSGGRFIRASLEAAGPAFWAPTSEVSRPSTSTTEAGDHIQNPPSTCPLKFFRFEAPDDGEGLKQMFKQRLVDLEVLLTDKERGEIVEEAQAIFDFMMKMVMELDDVCGTAQGSGSKLLSLRSRDSVVVEKERRLQMAEMAKKLGQQQPTKSSTSPGKSADGRRGWLRFL